MKLKPAKLKPTVLLLICGLLYFLSFPPYPTGFLAFVYLVPFFFLLKKINYKKGFRYGFALGICSIGSLYYYLNLNIGSQLSQSIAMYALSVIGYSFSFGLFGLAQTIVCKRFETRGFLAAPFLWTAIEYLNSLGECGVSWHSLATTQTYYTPIIQFVSLTGMYGLSFWIVFINVFLFFGFNAILNKSEKQTIKNIKQYKHFFAALILILIPLIYGLICLNSNLPKGETEDKNQISVASIQPNSTPVKKWNERNYAYMQLMKLTASLNKPSYDIIVWPETSVPFLLKENSIRHLTIQKFIKNKNAVLMGGFHGRREQKKVGYKNRNLKSRSTRIKNRKFRSVNTLAMVRHDTKNIETYEKVKLVPFGEYTPKSLSLLDDLMLNAGSGIYVAGKEIKVFNLPIYKNEKPNTYVKVAGIICLESVYSHLVSKFVKKGAALLIIVANDAWYNGTNEPIQHSQIAILRAIEHRISIIRSSNSGISSIIDPYGRIIASSNNDEVAIVEGSVPIKKQEAFFLHMLTGFQKA